jgi:hypothetical protein
MVSAKLFFASGIRFDDVTGIPALVHADKAAAEDTFAFDEANKTTISSKPTLQGHKKTFYIVNRDRSRLTKLGDF